MIAFLLYLALNNQMLSAQNLILKMKNATEIQNSLSEIKKLEFSGDNFLITMNSGAMQTYTLHDIQKLYFGTITAINPVITPISTITLFPNPAQEFIEIKNIPASAFSIKIFQTDGKLIIQENVTETSKTLDISKLNPGLYILNILNQSSKFFKL